MYACRVTNYWPFDGYGNRFEGFNGQCDHDCSVTATGIEVTQELSGTIAAMPNYYTGLYVSLSGYDDELYVGDRFGLYDWQNGPIWYEAYDTWAMPVDVMTPVELSYIDYGCWVHDFDRITKYDDESERLARMGSKYPYWPQVGDEIVDPPGEN
jgi:hypothetical protein